MRPHPSHTLVSIVRRRPPAPDRPSAYMDASEERRCVRAWKRNGDTAARNRLVTAHLKIAQYWAYRYRLSGAYEDLVNEGVLGLMHAADKFKPSKGCRFSTYAVPWVRSFVGAKAYALSSIVRPKQSNEAEAAWRRGEHPRDVALDNTDNEQWEPAMQQRRAREPGMVLQVRTGSAWRERSLTATDPAMLPDEVLSERERSEAAVEAVEELDERTQLILAARFSADATLDALGRHLGLSRERVRQIQAKALARLRGRLKEYGPGEGG